MEHEWGWVVRTLAELFVVLLAQTMGLELQEGALLGLEYLRRRT